MKLSKILLLTVAVIAFALPPARAQGNIKTAATLDGLTLLTPDPSYPVAFVEGWTASGDGGGGFFIWHASSALTTNYAIVASAISTKLITNNGVVTTIYLPGYGGQWLRAGGTAGAPPRTQTLAAATATKAEAPSIKVAGTSGATTISATPAIAANGLLDGQEITIIGTSDTDTVVYSDNGTVPGSKLELGASTRTLGVGDILRLKYNTATTSWYEIGFNNN